MQRVTITVDDDLLAEIDAEASARGYQNRSEIFRDLVRTGLQQSVRSTETGDCVAALVYVYDHESRDLSGRLVRNFHGHHDLSLATLHVHLDDENCMELTALQGPTKEVQHFADHVIAERGVKHGRVITIPMPAQSSGKPRRKAHSHG